MHLKTLVREASKQRVKEKYVIVDRLLRNLQTIKLTSFQIFFNTHSLRREIELECKRSCRREDAFNCVLRCLAFNKSSYFHHCQPLLSWFTTRHNLYGIFAAYCCLWMKYAQMKFQFGKKREKRKKAQKTCKTGGKRVPLTWQLYKDFIKFSYVLWLLARICDIHLLK